ncbi:MAG: 4-hydroxybenzoyl-CoA reductase subunit beta [Rhodospirillales bacterium]|nr:4-hydroxybenzoyl-CoA reductase subunit beta [Rhodospirillales bacterium]
MTGYMPEFDLLTPATVDEAVAMHRGSEGARFLAGGTDLIVNVRRGIAEPKALIDLAGVEEMKSIEAKDGGLRIGAAVTLAELLENRDLLQAYAAVTEAVGEVASVSHREVATIGGNLCLDTRCVYYNQSEWWRGANAYCLKYRGEICHVAPSGNHCFAAFSGDIAPAFLVFGAEVEIAGSSGRRRVPLGDIYADDGAAHLLLGEDEILTAVFLPNADSGASGYAKARVRGAIDFPLAGVAAAVKVEQGTLVHLRLALTGTNSCPLLLEGTDAVIGKPFDDEVIDTLVSLLPKQIQPMTSTLTPPGYRRRVAANLTRSLLRRLT